MELDWASLPGPCLQAVAQHMGVDDVLVTRLTCHSWRQAVALPQVSIGLKATASGLDQHTCRKLQSLLQALAHSHSAFSGVRQLVITFKPGSSVPTSSPRAHTAATEPTIQAAHQQQQSTLQAPRSSLHHEVPDGLQLLSQVLAALPHCTRLQANIHKPGEADAICCDSLLAGRFSLSSKSTLLRVQTCHAVMLPLLAMPQLQQQLHSLSLNCQGSWPDLKALAAALLRLQRLTSLQLHNCPIAVLTQLPSLQHLQQLSYSGRWSEPVPRSYSARQRPLLPLLPRLRRLALSNLPYDVRQQEQEDVLSECRAQTAMRGAPQKSSAACRVCCSGSSGVGSSGVGSSGVGSSGAGSAGPAAHSLSGGPPAAANTAGGAGITALTAAPVAAAGQGCGNSNSSSSGSGSNSSSNSSGSRGCNRAHSRPQQHSGTPSSAAAAVAKSWSTVRQWVTSSICQQCPQLQELQCDMLVGPSILQLPHLVTLAVPNRQGLFGVAVAVPAGKTASAGGAAVLGSPSRRAVGSGRRCRCEAECESVLPNSRQGCAAHAAGRVMA